MKDATDRKPRRNPNDVDPNRVRYVHLRRYDLDEKCYLPTGGVTLAYTHEDGMMRVGAAFCSLDDQYVKNTPKLPYTPEQFATAVNNVAAWCDVEWPRIQAHCAEYELGEPNERRAFMEWVRGFKYQVIRDLTMRIHTSNKPVHAQLPLCGRELALQRYDQSPCWLLPDPELGFSDWNNVVSRLTTRWAAKWLMSANAQGIWTKWELRPLATKRSRRPLKFTNGGVATRFEAKPVTKIPDVAPLKITDGKLTGCVLTPYGLGVIGTATREHVSPNGDVAEHLDAPDTTAPYKPGDAHVEVPHHGQFQGDGAPLC